MTRFRSALLILVLLSASPLMAKEWYDSYAEGIKAARAKNWSLVVSKMNEAIAKKPNEGDRERTYGAIFLNYKPYYYRGVAHLNLGNMNEAVRDLERTAGPGELELGSTDSLISKAQRGTQQPPPVNNPTTTTQAPIHTPTPTPKPPGPITPTVDPNIEPARRRAEALISGAQQKREEAVSREAQAHAASQFNTAQNLLLQAESRRANADSAADWKAVGDLADRSQRTFSLATSTAQAALTKAQTNVNAVAEDVLSPMKKQLRGALEDYFNGNFDRAASSFEALSKSLRNNASIHAYLGASYYYSWYLGGNSEPDKLNNAKKAFSQVRRLNPSMKLSSKYFSPRVRKYYDSVR
jgi:hypothetical protein